MLVTGEFSRASLAPNPSVPEMTGAHQQGNGYDSYQELTPDHDGFWCGCDATQVCSLSFHTDKLFCPVYLVVTAAPTHALMYYLESLPSHHAILNIKTSNESTLIHQAGHIFWILCRVF